MEEEVGHDHGIIIIPLSTINPLILLIIILLLTLLLILTSHLLKTKKKNKTTQYPLPPGPWKLPIIGNIHKLATSAALIHRRLADLAKQHGPLMHLQLGETSNVVVSSPELAREFLKTHDQNFAVRSPMPSGNIIFYDARDILFSPSDGAHWRRMRKICAMELLGERRVKSLRPIREEEVGKMVKFIRNQSRDTTVVATKYGGGMVNLSELLIAAASTMVSRAAFGKIRELEGSFLTLAHRVVQAMGGFSVGDIFPSRRLLRLITGTERKLRKLHEEGDMILQEIIDEHLCRRSTGTRRETYDEGEDLVDVLLNCTDDHVEVKAVILDMFLAGGDSSPDVVEWVMSELMKNPKEMGKVQREMRRVFDKKGKVVDEACFGELHYLKLVVKETLILHPSVPLSIPREGRENVVIDGYQVLTKTRVIINMWAINRDPSHWTQPDQFLPERFLDTSIDYKGKDFHFIPFGAGRRICPGMNYGTIVGYVLLANLLYHFDWKLPNQIKPQDLDMSEEFGATTVRKNKLYLIPIPYHAQ